MTTSELRSGSRSLTSSSPRAAVARQLILRARSPGRGTGSRELDAFAGDRSRTAAGYRASPAARRAVAASRPTGRPAASWSARGRARRDEGEADRAPTAGSTRCGRRPSEAVDRVLERPRLARMEREHAPRVGAPCGSRRSGSRSSTSSQGHASDAASAARARPARPRSRDRPRPGRSLRAAGGGRAASPKSSGTRKPAPTATSAGCAVARPARSPAEGTTNQTTARCSNVTTIRPGPAPEPTRRPPAPRRPDRSSAPRAPAPA